MIAIRCDQLDVAMASGTVAPVQPIQNDVCVKVLQTFLWTTQASKFLPIIWGYILAEGAK